MAFKLACIQITSGEDIAANIAAAARLIRDAKAAGAEIVATPENTAIMAARGETTVAAAAPEEAHPVLAAYRALAEETELWILLGSIGVRLPDGAARRPSPLPRAVAGRLPFRPLPPPHRQPRRLLRPLPLLNRRQSPPGRPAPTRG